MKDAQNSLQKKLHVDTIFTYIITAGFSIIAIAKLMTFFINLDSLKIAGENYEGTAPGLILADAILFAFLAVTLLMLSLILREIHSTGRPFSKKIINKLRTMAFLLIFASIIPDAAAGLVGFFDPNATYSVFQFENVNLGIMAFGVVIGLISEIFKYGYELQENMDSIA